MKFFLQPQERIKRENMKVQLIDMVGRSKNSRKNIRRERKKCKREDCRRMILNTSI